MPVDNCVYLLHKVQARISNQLKILPLRIAAPDNSGYRGRMETRRPNTYKISNEPYAGFSPNYILDIKFGIMFYVMVRSPLGKVLNFDMNLRKLFSVFRHTD